MARPLTPAERVDLAETRALLEDLRDQGWPLRAVAAAVGLPAGTVGGIVSGGYRRIPGRWRDRVVRVFHELDGWHPAGVAAPAPPREAVCAPAVDAATVQRIRVAARWGGAPDRIAADVGVPVSLVRRVLEQVAA